MFKMIGADRREYGPVSAEQIKQWISEGRVNSSTLLQAAGSSEWKPLSSFPEFSAPAAPPPLGQYSAPPVLSHRDDRKSKLAAGLFGILLPFGVHRFYLGYTTMGVLQLLTSFLCGVGIIWCIIEGILIIAGSTITTDAEGRPLKD